jgi:hypothetical protein
MEEEARPLVLVQCACSNSNVGYLIAGFVIDNKRTAGTCKENEIYQKGCRP